MPADIPSANDRLDETSVTYRAARSADAVKMWELVRASDALDTNSLYCYLLLCRDFDGTCVVACRQAEMLGFATAYRPPTRPDTVFVWQIGVAEKARGRGLAKRLLTSLLSLEACRDVRFLEATVTPSNIASRKLFESFAAGQQASCTVREGFTAAMFGPGDHEEEQLFRIGPLFTKPTKESSQT